MRKAKTVRARIEEHADGFGIADEEMVRERAREIALTNGRRPEQANEADFEQARQELAAGQTSAADDEEDLRPYIPRGTPVTSSGESAVTRLPTDEQVLPEDLVQEGVDEAAHDQMVEGNKRSRRRDKRFDDQLPSAESEA